MYGTHQPAVSDRPSNDTPCVTLSSDFEREDLGRVEPWDSKPGGSKGEGEDEHHSDGCVADSFVALGANPTEDGEKQHGNTLKHGAIVESPATTDTIECEHTDES